MEFHLKLEHKSKLKLNNSIHLNQVHINQTRFSQNAHHKEHKITYHIAHVVHAQVIRMHAHGGLQVVEGDELKVSLPHLSSAQLLNLPSEIKLTLPHMPAQTLESSFNSEHYSTIHKCCMYAFFSLGHRLK